MGHFFHTLKPILETSNPNSISNTISRDDTKLFLCSGTVESFESLVTLHLIPSRLLLYLNSNSISPAQQTQDHRDGTVESFESLVTLHLIPSRLLLYLNSNSISPAQQTQDHRRTRRGEAQDFPSANFQAAILLGSGMIGRLKLPCPIPPPPPPQKKLFPYARAQDINPSLRYLCSTALWLNAGNPWTTLHAQSCLILRHHSHTFNSKLNYNLKENSTQVQTCL